MREGDKERERGESREETSVSHPNRHFTRYGGERERKKKTARKKNDNISLPPSLSFHLSYLLSTV